jgi:hypothetical protein
MIPDVSLTDSGLQITTRDVFGLPAQQVTLSKDQARDAAFEISRGLHSRPKLDIPGFTWSGNVAQARQFIDLILTARGKMK